MGTIEFLLCIIIVAVIIYYSEIKPDKDFYNYMPPDDCYIDYHAQQQDMIKNNLTKKHVMRNTANGKYTKKLKKTNNK